jgi:ADP-ribose pyrophosphatase YjhB (NUDIX family)
MSYLNLYQNQPKYNVAVDCIVFGYENDELKLLLYPRHLPPSLGAWSLMGGFVQEEESMEETTIRVLKQSVGLENIFMEQVHAFSKPERDPGARVICMAFYALIRLDQHDKDLADSHGARWFPITNLPELIFDHDNMVKLALEKLQQTASFKLIGKELLPEQFTLTQLHNLYNAIFQRKFDAGNFRKKLASLNLLQRLTIKETTSSKRGAYYYTFIQSNDELFIDRIVKF